MFENTLMIIKSDYMSRRKCLLLHLLSKGFLIQGSRKLAFTPEDAAEFYKELADDKCYMLYVILLSKGTSEAFVLTKENAVEDLVNKMICYFGTSVEMERNIHVSRSVRAAQREITFILPNYIHEPIPMFDKNKFCKQTMVGPFLGQVYDIMQAPNSGSDTNWRTQLSDWLINTNAALPNISNQCIVHPKMGFIEKCQQTEPVQFKDDKPTAALSLPSSSIRDLSGALTSSSCVTCSSFDKEKPDICPPDVAELQARLKLLATKTLKEPCKRADGEEDKQICEEQIEWVEVFEYEDEVGIELEEPQVEGIAEFDEMATEGYQAEGGWEMSYEDKGPEMFAGAPMEEQIEMEGEELQGEEPTEPQQPSEAQETEQKPVEENAEAAEPEAEKEAEPAAAEPAPEDAPAEAEEAPAS